MTPITMQYLVFNFEGHKQASTFQLYHQVSNKPNTSKQSDTTEQYTAMKLT